jgi:hypothetical protein
LRECQQNRWQKGLLWQRILEEVAKIERVPSRTGGRRGFCGRES